MKPTFEIKENKPFVLIDGGQHQIPDDLILEMSRKYFGDILSRVNREHSQDLEEKCKTIHDLNDRLQRYYKLQLETNS